MSVNCHTEDSWEARVAWGVGSEEALIQSDHEPALASFCGKLFVCDCVQEHTCTHPCGGHKLALSIVHGCLLRQGFPLINYLGG